MKKRKKSSRKLLAMILDELIEIHEILDNEQSENKSLHWLLISQDDDIKKLKEKNKELKNKLKQMETKE